MYESHNTKPLVKVVGEVCKVYNLVCLVSNGRRDVCKVSKVHFKVFGS